MHYKKVNENYFQKIYANGTKKRISRKEYLDKIKKQKGGVEKFYLITSNNNKTKIGSKDPNSQNMIQITMDGDVYNYYKVQNESKVQTGSGGKTCENINSLCKEDDFICQDSEIIRYIPANRLDRQLKSTFVEKAEIKIGDTCIPMCYKEDGTCLKKKIEKKQKQAGGEMGLPKFLKQSPRKTLDTLRNLPTVSLISRKLGMDVNPMNEWYVAKNMEYIFGENKSTNANATQSNSENKPTNTNVNKSANETQSTTANNSTNANANKSANTKQSKNQSNCKEKFPSIEVKNVKLEAQSLGQTFQGKPIEKTVSARDLINGSLIVIIIGIILYCALLPGPCAVLFVAKKIYNSSKTKGKDGFLTKLKKFYYDVLMNQSFFPIGKLDENGSIHFDSENDTYRYFIKTTFSKETLTRQTLVTIDEIIAVKKDHIPKMKKKSEEIKIKFSNRLQQACIDICSRYK